MGLFGSVFGSSSSSKTNQTTTYNTTTNTTSNTSSKVRDMGLTGQAAVSLADISSNIGAATLKSNEGAFKSLTDTLNNMVNTVGLQTADANTFARDALQKASDVSANLTTSARNTSEAILSGSQSDEVQIIPYVIAGVVGITLIMYFKR